MRGLIFIALFSFTAFANAELVKVTARSGLASFVNSKGSSRAGVGVPWGYKVELLERKGSRAKVNFCPSKRQCLEVWVSSKYLKSTTGSMTNKVVSQKTSIKKQKKVSNESNTLLTTKRSGLSLREESYSGHKGKYICSLPKDVEMNVVSNNKKGWVKVEIPVQVKLSKKCIKNLKQKGRYDTKTDSYIGYLYTNKNYVSVEKTNRPLVAMSMLEADSCDSCSLGDVSKNDLHKKSLGLSATFEQISEQIISQKGFVLPVSSDCRMTSSFGNRKHPVYKKIKFHKGIDLSCKRSSSNDVFAAKSGKVIQVVNYCVPGRSYEKRRCGGGYGNFVKIRHDDGTVTRYAHLKRSSKCNVSVKRGQAIQTGQKIACIGNTGTSTANHLDFSVVDARGRIQNPSLYLGDLLSPKKLVRSQWAFGEG